MSDNSRVSAPVASDLREGGASRRVERLTATPGGGDGVTVWVERDSTGVRVWLRSVHPSVNVPAAEQKGWMRLSPSEWLNLRRCVDQYLAHFLGGAGPSAQPEPVGEGNTPDVPSSSFGEGEQTK